MLPPRGRDQLDSFGVLFDSLDVSGLLQTRSAIGVKRTSTRNHLEQRLGINFTLEKNQLDGERERYSRALVGTVGWTWREVDDSFAPRKGQIAQVDAAVSEKTLVSDQRFIRLFGKYQRWIPVAKNDSILLRAEAGQMFSESTEGKIIYSVPAAVLPCVVMPIKVWAYSIRAVSPAGVSWR